MGREQSFADEEIDEDTLVEIMVKDYFRGNFPALLGEVDNVFHSIYHEIDDEPEPLRLRGDRCVEGLAADAAFFTGSVVASAIWAATLLFRSTAHRDDVAQRRLEEILGELTGNPLMVAAMRNKALGMRIHLANLDSFLQHGPIADRPFAELRQDKVRDFQHKSSASARREAHAEPEMVAFTAPSEAERWNPDRADADLSLFVETRPDGVLLFKLHARRPELGLEFADMGSSRLLRELHDHVAGFAREAEKLHHTAIDRDDAAGRLERLGERLAQDILPARLLAALDSLRGQVDTLIVYSQAAIPWDLLRFAADAGKSGAFFCEAFALAGWLPEQRACFHLPLRRIGLIAPESDLGATAHEAKALLDAAGPERQVRELPARRAPLIRALRELSLDGVHFAGHGTPAPSPHPDLATLQLEGDETLDAIDIAPGSFPARPLVFLNACHSGVGAPALTGIGGLARAFVKAGAGAVIGSHWAINDRLAATFAAETYRLLLAGAPLARAVREARLLLKTRHPGDPTWVAYTVFGQPLAACRPEPLPQDGGSRASGS